MQIENKTELRNVVRSAVKDFINAHPEAMERKWIESVTKRVTGQLYCHYVHNKIKDGKIEDITVINLEDVGNEYKGEVTATGSDV